MNDVAETLRQIIVGRDFEPVERIVIKDAMRAVTRAPLCPYSIAENVAHANFWQQTWLAKLKGEPSIRVGPEGSWPQVSAEEWPSVRQEFLDGFGEAYEIARAEPFVHSMRTEEAALKVLSQIACHNAYHLGQVALLKRQSWEMIKARG